jgi:ABC-type enterochelin transport system permease subunit
MGKRAFSPAKNCPPPRPVQSVASRVLVCVSGAKRRPVEFLVLLVSNVIESMAFQKKKHSLCYNKYN